jgi:DNA (cytosine-5)-methyltransferase 1
MDRGDTGQNSRMIVEAVCYETNPTDARCSEIKDGVGPTVKARWGTGGNNQALVQQVNYGVDMYNGVVNDEVAVSVTSRTGIPDATGPRLMEVDEVQELSSQLMQVRRLTPLECERLQGFPDNWTQIPWRKKAAEDCPDGPRYKAIGNSMAVNVMQWIGIRIAMVKEICDDQD